MDPREQEVLAQALTENPLLQMILDELEKENIADWQAATDPQAREQCWHSQKAILDFTAKIRNRLNLTREKE